MVIGNSVFNGNGIFGLKVGQSFINDPSGTGATINLNTWTFDLVDVGNQNTAAASTFNIYSGTGSGGTQIGISLLPADASTAAVTGYAFPVTWTFKGGLPIIDNQTYTAVVTAATNNPIGTFFRADRVVSGNNPVYPNGVATNGTTPSPANDLVFQGTFSAATPVPFEFSPALGLGVLGGLFVLKKLVKKKKSS